MATKKLFYHGVHTIEFVETLIENINQQIKEGQQVSSFSSEGTSMAFFSGIPLDELLSQAAEFLLEARWYQENGITPRQLPVRRTTAFFPI